MTVDRTCIISFWTFEVLDGGPTAECQCCGTLLGQAGPFGFEPLALLDHQLDCEPGRTRRAEIARADRSHRPAIGMSSEGAMIVWPDGRSEWHPTGG